MPYFSFFVFAWFFLKESDLLRYNICTIKLTILSVKVDDFCVYSCTSLLSCYRTFLSYTKVPSYLYAVNSFLHVTWPLETTDAFSTPIVSPFLGFYMNAVHSVYFICVWFIIVLLCVH